MALLNFWRGGDIPATGTSPTKSEATLQYLSGFSPNVHSDLFAWDDPVPAVVEYWKLRKRLWGMVNKKLTTSPTASKSAARKMPAVLASDLEVVDLSSSLTPLTGKKKSKEAAPSNR
jgi:hypothetical protein